MIWCIVVPWAARAYQLSDDVEVRAVYRGEDYFRLTDTDRTFFDFRRNQFITEKNGVLMSQRNEFRIDFEMQLHTEQLWAWLGKTRGFIPFRPSVWFRTR